MFRISRSCWVWRFHWHEKPAARQRVSVPSTRSVVAILRGPPRRCILSRSPAGGGQHRSSFQAAVTTRELGRHQKFPMRFADGNSGSAEGLRWARTRTIVQCRVRSGARFDRNFIEQNGELAAIPALQSRLIEHICQFSS